LNTVFELAVGKDVLDSKILKEMQRRLTKHFLDIIILAELRNASFLGGYDIVELVNKKFGFLMSPGTVYGFLYSMERQGLVKGGFTEGKRTYILTDKGVDAVNFISKSKEVILRFIGTLF
jgi:DNA-binding PadR family transcriptional regulator